jgi:predicted nucleic acid-binding protein
MNNLLIDTNVLIYAIDEDSKYFHSVQRWLYSDNLKLFTTSKNISEFLAVVTRLPNASISISEALKITDDFQAAFTVLYPDEKSNLLFRKLLKKYSPQGLKIHDYEIVSIALANNIKKIATLNQKDFSIIDEIEIISF